MDGNMAMILGIIAVVFVVVCVFLSFVPLGLWISALSSGVHVSMGALIGMKIRHIKPHRLVQPLIKANKAGLGLNISQLETHFLAGGNVDRVINALIAAQRANIPMAFEKACAIDLAGRDVFEAVQMSVTPKVIETPVVAAIAKDGIELRAKARVTVRTNIDRLVGGAGEETVIARVGEGIVTTVGSAETHKQVLENPDLISRTVLSKGLDAGTAYEILSIDIADVDVGRNIGAADDGSGGIRPPRCAGEGRGTPRHGCRARAGNEGRRAGDARKGRRGGSRSSEGDGGCPARRQARRDGLLPDAEHDCGYLHARFHCQGECAAEHAHA